MGGKVKALKARALLLLTPVIDLLLDWVAALLAGHDESPGIVVSTIPELAQALMHEGQARTGCGDRVIDRSEDRVIGKRNPPRRHGGTEEVGLRA
jgi:hypothetical protein